MAVVNANLYVPFAEWEEVTVTFSSTANADTPIRHHINAPAPEDVRYFVVRADRAVRVYNDTSATRKAWVNGVIYLRADVASAVVTLFLYVGHPTRSTVS